MKYPHEQRFWISSEELRQFVYCKRIPYFRTYLNYRPAATLKMAEGTVIHTKITQQQLISEGEKTYFALRLEDVKEQLTAVIDKLVLVMTEGQTPEGRIVEFKSQTNKKGIELHHKAQLALQAYIAEKLLNIKITTIAVERTDGVVLIEEELSWEAKSWALSQINELRQMLNSEIIPPPTSHIGKCQDCEYWPICHRG